MPMAAACAIEHTRHNRRRLPLPADGRAGGCVLRRVCSVGQLHGVYSEYVEPLGRHAIRGMPTEGRLNVKQSNARTVAAACIVLAATLLGAQARPQYRTYRMGDDIAVVSQQLGVAVPAASPAGGTVRELRWRADYAA